MKELKLFTKDNCGKCEHVKERMPKGLKIQIINADTVDGLAEAAYYEIVEKTFPVLVVDGEVVCGALPILEKMNSIAGQK
ncbi:MAG: glutaredoxin family protein [Methanomassiliicoccaceae archaeon]|jgi:glutaredoxin|nr:glutaredoxin family protein [Methanomassiliicoccaceae archaeon]